MDSNHSYTIELSSAILEDSWKNSYCKQNYQPITYNLNMVNIRRKYSLLR